MKHKKSNKTIKSKFEDIFFFFRYRLHTTGQYEYIIKMFSMVGRHHHHIKKLAFQVEGGKG